MNTPSPRIHIAIIALLERQLSDWQAIRDELSVENALAKPIAYCTACIERLKVEVIRIAHAKHL